MGGRAGRRWRSIERRSWRRGGGERQRWPWQESIGEVDLSVRVWRKEGRKEEAFCFDLDLGKTISFFFFFSPLLNWFV